jgi:hypothetical protein
VRRAGFERNINKVDDTDRKIAFEDAGTLKVVGGREDEFLDDMELVASKILEWCWPAVEAVADEALRLKYLDADELSILIRRAVRATLQDTEQDYSI